MATDDHSIRFAGFFLNTAPAGHDPKWEEVADQHITDPDVVPMWIAAEDFAKACAAAKVCGQCSCLTQCGDAAAWAAESSSATPSAVAAEDARGNSLHPATQDLVRRFSAALSEKLAAAQQKYGYSDGWMRSDWMDECRQHLRAHVEKGDPRDVAAYCAFLWHHGESTATQMSRDGGKNIPFVAADNAIAATDAALTSAYAEGREDEAEESMKFRLRIARLLAELHGEEYLSEQQCAKYMGIDLVSWRRIERTFSVGTWLPEGSPGELLQDNARLILRDALSASPPELPNDGECPSIVATPHTAPAVAEPKTEALLVRDVASFFDVEPLVICVALRTLGFGEFSINTGVSAGMVRELQKFFEAKPAVAAEAGQGIVGHLGKLDPDEGDAVRLWAEIHLLREMLKGPPGFTSWQDAAVSERMAKNEALRKLATQPAPPSQGQWLPIETAPKDGRQLIVWWGGRWRSACWLDNSKTSHPWAGWKVPSLEPRPIGEPTHWMEPAAPTQPPAEGGA